eukprot:s1288_g17.t1
MKTSRQMEQMERKNHTLLLRTSHHNIWVHSIGAVQKELQIQSLTDRAMEKRSMELLSQIQSKLNRSPPMCVPRNDKMLGSELSQWSILTDAMSASSASTAWWGVLDKFAAEDRGCDSAIGCLLGLALGDAVGAPLEFCAVDASPQESCADDDRRPYLATTLKDGQLHYRNVRNKFDLKLGQWTDDASMALCLADSLLTCGHYDGGDARVRWHMWWQ